MFMIFLQLGFDEDIGDAPFDNVEGMKNDIAALADKEEHWLDTWKGETRDRIDGVLFITGDSKASVDAGMNTIKTILGETIIQVHEETGLDREIANPAAKGKEQ
jgi:hypothetical protein